MTEEKFKIIKEAKERMDTRAKDVSSANEYFSNVRNGQCSTVGSVRLTRQQMLSVASLVLNYAELNHRKAIAAFESIT